MAALMTSVVAGVCAHTSVTFSSQGCCRASFAAPSPNFAARTTPRHSCCEALPEPVPGTPAVKVRSILCAKCDGNGVVVCSQCKGDGLNAEDHFNGRFKAGTICWLCRGKKQILCGSCNGAGFMGGFMSSLDD